MSLDTQRLFAHLMKAKAQVPTMPKSPAIKQAEKIEQQAKKAVGVSEVEREVTDHTNNLDSMKSVPDARAIAEASLSPAVMRKLLSGEKLSTDEQKQVAVVCKQVGFL